MKYTVEIIKGSLAGKSYDLTPGNAMMLGRSHTNDIQFTEEDVSKRHLSILLDTYGSTVLMEVLSARETLVDGRKLSMGDKIELENGNVVQLGKIVQIRIARREVSVETVKNQADNLSNAATVPPTGTNVVQGTSSRAVQSVIAEPSASNAMTQAPPSHVSPSMQATVNPPPNQMPFSPQPQPSSQPASIPVNAESSHAPALTNATKAAKTRMASAEEIQALKGRYRKERRRRLLTLVIGAAIFLALGVTLYITQRPKREEFITWPLDASGNRLSEGITHASYPYFASLVPDVALKKVKVEDGNAEVFARIGKLRDVPLHVVISTSVSKEGLTISRSQAFAEWLASMRKAHPDMSFNGNGRVKFINVSEGAGVPITVESYTRRLDNDDYYGYVAYFRHAANVHYVMAEVPLVEQWRCDTFLWNHINTWFLVYAMRRTSQWWEGNSHYRKASSIDEDLEEAGRYMRHESPTYWEKIHYLTRSALIKAALDGNEEALKQAIDLMTRLRSVQASWYNTKKLAYQYAMLREDKGTMQSIQSQGEMIFSSEFQEDDYRYDYIRRKEWK